MIIVYQSLESIGKMVDTGQTVILGSTHKRIAQDHAHTTSPDGVDHTIKKFDAISDTVIEETEKKHFATKEECVNFYDTLKQEFKTGDNSGLCKEQLEYMLHKIVGYIVACCVTRTQTTSNHRAGGLTPDVIVLGEIGGKDLIKKKIGNYFVVHSMDPSGDPRHRFTVLKRNNSTCNPIDFQLYYYKKTDPTNKGIAAVCVRMRIKGWLIVCVHIPNSICQNGDFVRRYMRYNVIQATKMRATEPDLIIGDTNQANNDDLVTFMNEGRPEHLPKWKSSISADGTQTKVGPDANTISQTTGTNSRSNNHFDIAATPHAFLTPEMNPEDIKDEEPAFCFRGVIDKFFLPMKEEKLYAYSDHLGIIVQILHDKPEHFIRKKAVEVARLLQNKFGIGKRKREEPSGSPLSHKKQKT